MWNTFERMAERIVCWTMAMKAFTLDTYPLFHALMSVRHRFHTVVASDNNSTGMCQASCYVLLPGDLGPLATGALRQIMARHACHGSVVGRIVGFASSARRGPGHRWKKTSVAKS